MSERKTANEPTEKRGRVNEQKKKEKKGKDVHVTESKSQGV